MPGSDISSLNTISLPHSPIRGLVLLATGVCGGKYWPGKLGFRPCTIEGAYLALESRFHYCIGFYLDSEAQVKSVKSRAFFMPQGLTLIFIFYLIYLYLTMKKPNTPIEKPAIKATTAEPVATVVTEAKPEKSTPTRKTAQKSQDPVTKPAPKAKTEQPAASVVAEAKPKTNTVQKSTTKAKAVEPVAVAPTAELSMSERVGLTAGEIWHYLDKNGATAVAKLVKELPEEEKIIQRSIGWLAQEGKITLEIINRIETIGLKG